MSAATKPLKVGSLFSGIGGLDLAVEQFFDAETAWHCEWDEEPSKVLAARWPGVPNYRDVRTVDWASVEPVDIMCGGFPCQDVSLAGRRAGMKEGTRSGLWSEFANAIDIVRPKVVVIENVRGLLSADAGSNVEPCPWCMGDGADEYHLRALDAVVADLSDLGFDAEWTGLRAADVGAPHGRFRFFLLAYARGVRLDARWDAASRQAAGGRASTVAGGRADAPLTLLPTPVAQPSGNTPEDHLRKKPGREVVTDLAILVENGLLETGGRLLPTPIVSDGTGGPKSLDGAQFAPQLREIKQLLPTPTTEPDTGNGHARNLGKEVKKLLPTPRAARGASGTETMYRLGAERDDTGDRQGNVILPTPMTSDDRSPAPADLRREHQQLRAVTAWGEYEPAVRLWESLTRPAPAPTLPDGKNGNHRLAAVFPEWMMGYSAGWVTDILRRNPAIKACGNGVVPQQAYAALTVLWSRVLAVLAVAA